MGIYKRFEGKKWKDIDDSDREFLLKNAFCFDARHSCITSDGDCVVYFAETLSAMGKVHDGLIMISDDEKLYNPFIGNNGQPMGSFDTTSISTM